MAKRPSKLDILQLVQQAQRTGGPNAGLAINPAGPQHGTAVRGMVDSGGMLLSDKDPVGTQYDANGNPVVKTLGPHDYISYSTGGFGGAGSPTGPISVHDDRENSQGRPPGSVLPPKKKPVTPPDDTLDPMAQLNDLFAKLYPDETQGIRDAYGAQIKGVNDSYASELARLQREHDAGVTGVKREGANLQAGLTALGQDARVNMAKDTAAVKADFATGDKATRDEMASLTNDLKNSGVNPAGLHAEAVARNTAVKAMGANAAGLSDRYGQLMNQEINDRQATGQLLTTGSVDDLARIMANAQGEAGVTHEEALGKLYAGMAGDIAAAKSDAAKAKFSLFASVLKSGGTLGAAGLKTLTPAAIKAAAGVAAGAAPKWQVAFAVLNKTKDPGELQYGARFLQQIVNSKDPIAEVGKAFANWQAQPQDTRDQNPHVTEALMTALGMAQYALQVKQGTGATLGVTGYDIGQ